MDSPGLIFGTVVRQSRPKFQDCFRTDFGFGFDSETDICGFCGVSCNPNNSVTNREGTKRYPILCGSEIWVILCVIVVKY